MRLYIWKLSACVPFQRNENNLFFLVANDELSEATSVSSVFGPIQLLTCCQCCSHSHKHPPPFCCTSSSPCPRAQKKVHCAGRSESRGVWFWLARCAASETLTFLQGLHLELVSCSGSAEQGQGLAQLCDWPRLSLYGPRDGWNCQTVIRQSLAYRFKPEHNVTENIQIVQSCK